MPKKSFFSSSFCCIISFTQFTIVKHFAMSKKAERAKYFSNKSDGYKFLSEQFTAFDDSNGARGLDPNTSDQNSILGIYDKYAIFSPYSRSQFPAGFRRCASKRAIGKFKDRKRFIGEDAKTCKSSSTNIYIFYSLLFLTFPPFQRLPLQRNKRSLHLTTTSTKRKNVLLIYRPAVLPSTAQPASTQSHPRPASLHQKFLSTKTRTKKKKKIQLTCAKKEKKNC